MLKHLVYIQEPLDFEALTIIVLLNVHICKCAFVGKKESLFALGENTIFLQSDQWVVTCQRLRVTGIQQTGVDSKS
jgi:hypothetical protein